METNGSNLESLKLKCSVVISIYCLIALFQFDGKLGSLPPSLAPAPRLAESARDRTHAENVPLTG